VRGRALREQSDGKERCGDGSESLHVVSAGNPCPAVSPLRPWSLGELSFGPKHRAV